MAGTRWTDRNLRSAYYEGNDSEVSRLTDLIRQAKAANPQLGEALDAEFRAVAKERHFGLVFEKHQPEAVELPQRPVRRGDKVRVLPPRGTVAKGDQRLWKVTRIERADDARYAHLALIDSDPEETDRVAADDLVVVAEFRDRIYPGLVETGRVERGGDKPFHTVINGENFHALEALTYTNRHAIDVIYIDPPYNTGAKDWKYNNDYVQSDDDYRHSKWLSFMERRLLIAKELLNPARSTLIVAIDENEVHRLALLLEQLFPALAVQMVTVVINPSGASGTGLSRVEEHLLIVRIGDAEPSRVADNLLTDMAAKDGRIKDGLSWESFLRSGVGNDRAARPNLCYPILIDRETQRIVRAGEPLRGDDSELPSEIDGYSVAWPIKKGGALGIWRRDGKALTQLAAHGYAYVSSWDETRSTWSLKYLLKGTIDKITDKEIVVERSGALGQVVSSAVHLKGRVAKTVWNRPSHNAGKHGSDLLSALIPGKPFTFPKSLYAVEDALRLFVLDNPDAVVLDFFAGSGTTAHAVMRLNRQDGGRRKCILVTNNEVAVAEQKSLREAGLRPGDLDWERGGICDNVTKPRIRAAIEGVTHLGTPVNGEYAFVDQSPLMEGLDQNAVFYTLTYETPLTVSHNGAFERIAPLLWLRAGSMGRVIDNLGDRGWDVADSYGVLENLDRSTEFVRALSAVDAAQVAFVVTNDDRRFQMVCAQLPSGLLPVRLYESYLLNFEVNTGRGIA